ncbi:MAG: UDP-N-acetylglucosamine 2-epimerase (non-hydrolyzing), partial [Clostridia bacterium]|nr:UDP-N-acetylglucosamine 2-epimerase (non-hydrolyzing) [Clostridia bacterium]
MNRKIKVMTIFGTRPEAIKMAPLVLELKERKEIETIVCVTAQHREMLDQVLQIFNIVPDYDLDIMQKGQTLTELTSRVLVKLDNVIKEVKPDIVLVHGDTTTSFVGALAAFYNKVKIGHVEAGLRTYDLYSPFPEEANRQFVGVLADLNFSPTENSKNNLLKEQKKSDSIFVTGNTAIDALKYTVKSEYSNEILDWAKDSRMVLLTAHRRENWGEPMKNIFNAIKRILKTFKDIKIVYPVHLNPIVRDMAYEMFTNDENADRIKLIEPLDVIDFHNFM